MEKQLQMLRAFYRKHGLPVNDGRRENVQFHISLLMEELGELAKETNRTCNGKAELERRARFRRELCDVLYVVLGIAVSCDVDGPDESFESAFVRVHMANMEKALVKMSSKSSR